MITWDTDNSHAAATVTISIVWSSNAGVSPTLTTIIPGGDTVTWLSTVTIPLQSTQKPHKYLYKTTTKKEEKQNNDENKPARQTDRQTYRQTVDKYRIINAHGIAIRCRCLCTLLRPCSWDTEHNRGAAGKSSPGAIGATCRLHLLLISCSSCTFFYRP